MNLDDILNTEDFTTHDVSIEVKGGVITLQVTDKFTSAWNIAQLNFNRAQSKVYMQAPKDKDEQVKFFDSGEFAKLIKPAEHQLYASLVTGWSLDTELTQDGVAKLFDAYPIVAPSIDSHLNIVAHKRDAEKKSLLKQSSTDSSEKNKAEQKT